MASSARRSFGLGIVIGLVATMCLAILAGPVSAATGGEPAAHHKHRDSDRDGIPNKWERNHGLNPHKRADAKQDPDQDALRNLGEFRNHTGPHRADTDGDGLYDGAEVKEFGSDPCDEDSDDDGQEDGEEDTNDDGVVDEGQDGDHEGFVGTIVSFDAGNGQLVFESTLGWPVTALINEKTKFILEEEAACDVEAECLLQEGVDIVELGFAAEPFHGVPVVRWIVLACPWAQGDD